MLVTLNCNMLRFLIFILWKVWMCDETLKFKTEVCLTKYSFSFLQDIFRKLRLWKLIVSVFAFSSTPELMFGLYLLYYFRVFERQIGSNKYSVSYYPALMNSLGIGTWAMSFKLTVWIFPAQRFCISLSFCPLLSFTFDVNEKLTQLRNRSLLNGGFFILLIIWTYLFCVFLIFIFALQRMIWFLFSLFPIDQWLIKGETRCDLGFNVWFLLLLLLSF